MEIWKERRESIVKDFESGMSRKDIAVKYDVTYPRVCMVINKHEAKKS